MGKSHSKVENADANEGKLEEEEKKEKQTVEREDGNHKEDKTDLLGRRGRDDYYGSAGVSLDSSNGGFTCSTKPTTGVTVPSMNTGSRIKIRMRMLRG